VTSPGDVVTLSVPAGSEYVGLVRTVAAGVAARLDLDLDHVEDMRLAVSEACTVLLGLAGHAGRLEVTLRVAEGGVDVVVARATTASSVLADDSFAWTVLEALADEVASTVTGGVASIRLRFGAAEETAGTGSA
jgi:serine/threonine-protein kinase RsbW